MAADKGVLFLKAIFGFGGAKAAAAGTLFKLGVFVSRIAILGLTSKALLPKPAIPQISTDKLLTIRSTTEHQREVIGTDLVSGPIVFTNTGNASNQTLFMLLALTGVSVSDIRDIWFDSDVIADADIDDELNNPGSSTSAVTAGKYRGDTGNPTPTYIQRRRGVEAFTDPILNGAFPSLWTSAHLGTGIGALSVRMDIAAGQEDVYPFSQPQNVKALIDGSALFDPRAYALNADPGFVYVGEGGDWFALDPLTASSSALTNPATDEGFSSVTVSGAPAGNTAIEINNNDDSSEGFCSVELPVDTSKLYTLTVQARQPTGDRRNYLLVAFFDSNRDHIQAAGSGATGWTAMGTFFYWQIANQAFPTAWTNYTFTFGPGGTATIPAGAAYMRIAALCTRDGPVGTSSQVQIQDYRVFEGATEQDPDTPGDWLHSANPVQGWLHYLRISKYGPKFPNGRFHFHQLAAEANICDEHVTVPDGLGGSTTQPRYTVNTTISAQDDWRDVERAMVENMLGTRALVQGKICLWAGAERPVSVTFTEDDRRGKIQVQADAPNAERFNIVRGKFVWPDEGYQLLSYPEVRDSAYITEDGGEKAKDVDWPLTNNIYEAQRKSIIVLRQTRNMQITAYQAKWSGMLAAPGDMVAVDEAALSWSGERFMCGERRFPDGGGVDLTLLPYDSTVWADPALIDYSERNAAGAIGFADIGVPAPTGLQVFPHRLGVLVIWDNPPDQLFDQVEVWASTTNDRATATMIARTKGIQFVHELTVSVRQYYWIRAIDEHGRVSAWLPTSTTSVANILPFPKIPPPVDDSTFFDAFDYADQADLAESWEPFNIDGVAVTFPEEATSIAGGRVLEANGAFWYAHRNLIPYDESALYKISARARMTVRNATPGNERLYVGLVGVAADGETLINMTGADNHGLQHYLAASYYDVYAAAGSALDVWIEVVGHVTGISGVAADHQVPTNTQERASILNPGTMQTGVKYIRPLFICNWNDGDGTMQLDWLRIEKVPIPLAGVVRDPYFALPLGQAWEDVPSNFTVSPTAFGPLSTIEADGGEESSNALQLNTDGTDTEATVANTNRFEIANNEPFLVRARVRRNDDFLAALNIGIRYMNASETERRNLLIGFDVSVVLPDQDWNTIEGILTFTLASAITDGSRLQAKALIQCQASGSNTGTVDVDYLEVFRSASLFQGGEGATGMVPVPVTADSKKSLRSDGNYGSSRATIVELDAVQTFALVDAETTQVLSGTTNRIWTVPPESSVDWEIGDWIGLANGNTGEITIAEGAGVTVDSVGGNLRLDGQGAGAMLLYTGSDTWLLIGNLGA